MAQQKTNKFFAALAWGMIFPTVVFTVHLLTLFLYDVWWPYDIPMHFLGGVSIAYGGAIFLKRYKGTAVVVGMPYWFTLTFFVGLTMTIGVLWEFAEYGSDLFFGTVNQQGLRDTMGDLAMDMFGALVGAFLGTRRK